MQKSLIHFLIPLALKMIHILNPSRLKCEVKSDTFTAESVEAHITPTANY